MPAVLEKSPAPASALPPWESASPLTAKSDDVHIRVLTCASDRDQADRLLSLCAAGALPCDVLVVVPGTWTPDPSLAAPMRRLARSGARTVCVSLPPDDAAAGDYAPVLFEADARHALLATVASLGPGARLLVVGRFDGASPWVSLPALHRWVQQGLKWRAASDEVENGDFTSLPAGGVP